MSERFDPYYTWLGIPPHEQPANHYRLLGISLLESNDEVISNAADRLMLHLRAFQTGKRSKESQQLLNEISAARVCLLNPEKKAAYDAKLRAERESAEAAAAPPAGAALKLPTGDPSLSYVAIAPPKPRRSVASAKPQARTGWWLIGGSLALLALAGGIALVVANQGRKKSVADARPAPVSSQRPAPVSHQREPKTVNSEPAPEPEPAAPSPPPSSPPVKSPVPAVAIVATPAPEPSPLPTPPTGAKAAADVPSPGVPDAAAIADASKQVQSQFATQIAAAKRADQKLALAETLRSEADKAASEPARRAALWLEAQRLAASAGDLKLAMTVLRQRVDRLQLDLPAEVAEMLKAISYPAAQRRENAALAELAVQFGEQAIEENRFEAAETLLKAASQAYLRVRNVDAGNRLKDQLADVALMKPEYDKVKSALETLTKNSKDADANLAVGRYECFFKSDWDKGLFKLAAGSDPELAAAAKKDLERPKPAAASALADQWWDIGQKLPPGPKRTVHRRAAEWYLVALPGLTGGPRAAALRRLEQGTPGRGEPTALVKEGLIGYWGFDEGQGRLAQDMTKNKNHALLVGATWTKGPLGDALSLRGSAECAEVLAPIRLQQWTLSLWVRVDQLVGESGLYMARANNPGCIRLHVGRAGAVRVNLQNMPEAGSERLELGQWHHVVCRYLATDKGNGELWIDGAMNAKFAGNKDVVPILGPARIGGWSDDDPGRPSYAAIDDVRLYGRVLRDEEIAALRQAGQTVE